MQEARFLSLMLRVPAQLLLESLHWGRHLGCRRVELSAALTGTALFQGCAMPPLCVSAIPGLLGASCDLLNLAPANPDAGLQVPGYFSWGGHTG